MFEQLFGRAIGSTSSIGATSGSANFRETSAEVGDILHADFTWFDALQGAAGYAYMEIIDPAGNTKVNWLELLSSRGSRTLSCTANILGTWTAKISIWRGVTWLVYTDTIVVTQLLETSGSANFRESSAVVGDTLHADFTWNNAQYRSSTYGYGVMELLNPAGAPKVSHYEKDNANGSRTLEFIANMAGTWTAQINIWTGSKWIQYVDTVNVTTGEGLAIITDIDKPSEFTPGVEFTMGAWIKNIGDVTDILFMDIYNSDTDELLCTLSLPVQKGIRLPFPCLITLTQTTDFHGLINVGHLG